MHQTYNALQTQLNTEYAMMQSEINETENSIKELERTWNDLQVTYGQTKNLMATRLKTKQKENIMNNAGLEVVVDFIMQNKNHRARRCISK